MESITFDEISQPQETDLEVAQRLVTSLEDAWGKYIKDKRQIEKLKKDPESVFVFCTSRDEYRDLIGNDAHKNSIGHTDRRKSKIYLFTNSSNVSGDKPWTEIRKSVIAHEIIEFNTGLKYKPETEKIRPEVSSKPTVIGEFGSEILYFEHNEPHGFVAIEPRKKQLREFLTDALAKKLLEANGEKYSATGYVDGRNKIGNKLIEILGEDVVANAILTPDCQLLNTSLGNNSEYHVNLSILSDACEEESLDHAVRLIGILQ